MKPVSKTSSGMGFTDNWLAEWTDVQYTPVERAPMLNIECSDDFRATFGLLRAVRALEERSERCLRLAQRAIKLNSASPTAWAFRREVVFALASAESSRERIWNAEQAFVAAVIRDRAKNYQAWEYRRWLVGESGRWEAEAGFVDLVLQADAKNYHAWSLRAWLVREYDLLDGELDVTEWFISDDVRNNSAWNHRWLVTGIVPDARDVGEVQWAMDLMMQAPRNECPWNYVHALGKVGVDVSRAKSQASQVLELDAGNVPARRFLVLNASAEDAFAVEEHCRILSSGVDPVRSRYWMHRRRAAQVATARNPA